jgi:cytoskeletal protein CcmA (bactofilin family)
MSAQVYGRMRRGERGFALVAAVVFLTVILILGASMVASTVQELHSASKIRKDTQALNLAEAGVDYAAWKAYNIGKDNLVLPVTYTSTDLPEGSFRVTVSQYQGTNDNLVIESTGYAQDATASNTSAYQSKVKVIGSFLTTGIDLQNHVFDFGIFSGGPLQMGGSLIVTGLAHANGNITTTGNPTVTGQVTTSGTTVQSSKNFQGGTQTGVPRIAMPVVDLAWYRANANQVLSDGANLSGNVALDGITYVDGSCSINANFTGTGVIVASGTITINGNATVENDATDGFALISATSVRMNGDCVVEGWIYAHNVTATATIDGNGSAVVTGGVAGDTVNRASGNLTVTYRQIDVDLPGGDGAPAQFAACSWRRVK